MSLPDYRLLKMSNAPCKCGVNREFFRGYKEMRTLAEQINYQRRHKDKLIPRKNCCHTAPWNPRRGEPGQPEIDPEAVLWRSQSKHTGDAPCDHCPTCIMLPALQKLYKVCSHASLLQVERNPDFLTKGSCEWNEAKNKLDFARVALPQDVLKCLPGGSYFRKDGIMEDHVALSGKMGALDFCLTKFSRQRDRVLVFSYSTAVLDLIQHYVRSKGYSHLRLDGSTPTKKRQGLVDKFQGDDTIFLFLISTRAGGLGLNLTAANRVIVYDVNWNPSHDEQAQDRAFRIGQNRDVDVIRLVAEGTVEELMYARQIYKVQLKKQTLAGVDSRSGPQPARLFRGVDGDRNRKGELFGLENLLKFKVGSFMADMWKASDEHRQSGQSSLKMRDASHVASAMSNASQKELENIGLLEEERLEPTDLATKNISILTTTSVNHNDFLREDRGGAALNQGDDGFDEEVGGETQTVHAACALACQDIDTDAEADEMSIEVANLRDSSPARKSNRNSGMTTMPTLDLKIVKKKRVVSRAKKQENLSSSDYSKETTSPNISIMGFSGNASNRKCALSIHSLYIPSYLRESNELRTKQ
uniref:Helicase C-terminal domain-containing protein n=1 Tax=Ditylum brightwellii TaxID=49249 RepID=A0A7S4RME9_9STRA|mmetsp:Transcript_34577/g.46355  ORF Transcript_34577/g.46355 Transcript_34577/m.46355 type:complete len:585 (+) Transcript_34577:603-2357(+)